MNESTGHIQLKRQLLDIVPAGWNKRLESSWKWTAGTKRWRADVLAWKFPGPCVVALEAQCSDLTVDTRSDAMLKVGVWPLWIFDSVSKRRRQSQPVFTIEDIPLLPYVLAALCAFPIEPGLTWVTAQPTLWRAIELANTSFDEIVTVKKGIRDMEIKLVGPKATTIRSTSPTEASVDVDAAAAALGAERAARLFLQAPAPEPSPSDVGSVPVAHNGCSDTCASFPDPDDLQGRSKVSHT